MTRTLRVTEEWLSERSKRLQMKKNDENEQMVVSAKKTRQRASIKATEASPRQIRPKRDSERSLTSATIKQSLQVPCGATLDAVGIDGCKASIETLPASFILAARTGSPVRLTKPRRKVDKLEPLEWQIQAAYVAWCRHSDTLKRYPEVARGFHIPNGEKRAITTAKRLKAMGVRPGVPDWFLPVARGGYFGLWIEFKAPGKAGRLTKAQIAEGPTLWDAGYQAVVCDDWQEAAEITRDYLDQLWTLAGRCTAGRIVGTAQQPP